MQSSFTIDPDAEFSWQHDARFLSSTATTNTISMFDDNCCESETIPPGTPPSHGLVLTIDFTTINASLVSSFYHDPPIIVASQGNVQTFSNGTTNLLAGDNRNIFQNLTQAAPSSTMPQCQVAIIPIEPIVRFGPRPLTIRQASR